MDEGLRTDTVGSAAAIGQKSETRFEDRGVRRTRPDLRGGLGGRCPTLGSANLASDFCPMAATARRELPTAPVDCKKVLAT